MFSALEAKAGGIPSYNENTLKEHWISDAKSLKRSPGLSRSSRARTLEVGAGIRPPVLGSPGRLVPMLIYKTLRYSHLQKKV